jgi:protein-S-isoprenylcysteine O-methyltransferase Ste14
MFVRLPLGIHCAWNEEVAMSRSTRLFDYSMMVLAVVFGAGSVALWAADGSFASVRMEWSDTTLLLWDAGLSLAFFLQHSGMVRKSFRVRMAALVPPHYERAVYAIASGVVLTAVVLLWQRSESCVLVLEGVLRWVARGCTVLAITLFIWAARSLRPFDPLGLAPIRAHLRGGSEQPPAFVVHGPYRWVRHPLYSCVILLIWSNPDLTADRLLFNALWTAWICVASVLEERDLADEFRDAYQEYRRRVPMLIPWRGPVMLEVLNERVPR